MSRISIVTRFSPGKVCPKSDRGTFAVEHVRAYVAPPRTKGASTGAAVLVATDGRILSVVPAHAETGGGPDHVPDAFPVAFNLPPVALSRPLRVESGARKVRTLSATLGATVSVSEPRQPTETADNNRGFVPWSDLVKGDAGKAVSVTLSVDLLSRLCESIRDTSAGKKAPPQSVRLTFEPDRDGNAFRAVLVSSGEKPNGDPEPCGLIMPMSAEGNASAHFARVRASIHAAADIARTTGAPEIR